MKTVHWETVTPKLREVLEGLGEQPWMSRFYLGGGTALALQIGHRRSIDLDFFSASDPIDQDRRQSILHALGPFSPLVIESIDGNLLVRVDEALHVAFLGYEYPLLSSTERIGGVDVASVKDLGLMKLDAMIGRGSRKDFIDLFFVAQEMPLDQLLEASSDKYPYARDFPLLALEHMLRFDNADRDRQPDMLVEAPWTGVRDFFLLEARRLGRAWFDDASGGAEID